MIQAIFTSIYIMIPIISKNFIEYVVYTLTVMICNGVALWRYDKLRERVRDIEEKVKELENTNTEGD